MKQFARPEEEPAVSTPVDRCPPFRKPRTRPCFAMSMVRPRRRNLLLMHRWLGLPPLFWTDEQRTLKSKADNILASIQEQGVAAPLHNQHLVEQVQEPQLKHSDKAQLNTPPDDDLEF